MQNSIQKRRKEAGLTQDEIASKLGLSVSQYSRLERSPDRARGEQLAIIAKVLGCTVTDLHQDNDRTDVVSLAGTRRTVPIYSLSNSDWTKPMPAHALQIGTYAPTAEVSAQSYAVTAEDDSLSNNGRRSIFEGDDVLIDPAVTPAPGDIVHAVDPSTQAGLLRIYTPLHPSNARAPGYLLKASDPSLDDIYINAKTRGVIRGVVKEVRTQFRK